MVLRLAARVRRLPVHVPTARVRSASRPDRPPSELRKRTRAERAARRHYGDGWGWLFRVPLNHLSTGFADFILLPDRPSRSSSSIRIRANSLSGGIGARETRRRQGIRAPQSPGLLGGRGHASTTAATSLPQVGLVTLLWASDEASTT